MFISSKSPKVGKSERTFLIPGLFLLTFVSIPTDIWIKALTTQKIPQSNKEFSQNTKLQIPNYSVLKLLTGFAIAAFIL